MGNGLSLRKAARLLSFLPLLALAGCLEFDFASTVSWSPSGESVAFLSRGRPFIYSLKRRALAPLPVPGVYAGLAWSPAPAADEEGWIALSTVGVVRLACAACGERGGPSLWDFPIAGLGTETILQWRPDGRRLLAADFTRDLGATWEIDLETRSASRAGFGAGFYGPGAHWLLWFVPVSVGRRDDFMIVERQAEDGRLLTLEAGASSLILDGWLAMVDALGDPSPWPLCPARSQEKARRTVVYCVAADGSIDRRAVLPAAGRVFPDRSRRLFAVLTDRGEEPPALAVYDGAGRRRADGAALAQAVRDGASEGKGLKASRLAWSPDGNWLAWAADGKLFLWNWRNDLVRVHDPDR